VTDGEAVPAPPRAAPRAVPRAVPPTGRRPLAEQPASVASAYDLVIAGESARTRDALRRVLASPARARTAVLAAEILGSPRALRPYGAD
jgi:hypothetical protein